MQTVTAVALVGAGICSVLLFPLVGFAILDRAGPLDEALGEASARQR
jgi:hypothetical protein